MSTTRLFQLKGGWAVVVEKSVETFDNPIEVYNFQVDKDHDYFVLPRDEGNDSTIIGSEESKTLAATAILVHNAGEQYDPKSGEVIPADSVQNGIYNGIRNAPNYPQGFTPIQNGLTKNPVKYKPLLAKLREIEPGKWQKVYKDGYDANGNKVSIHYFESPSGKVFDVEVKQGWSNQ